jgi:hypothetical protein
MNILSQQSHHEVGYRKKTKIFHGSHLGVNIHDYRFINDYMWPPCEYKLCNLHITNSILMSNKVAHRIESVNSSLTCYTFLVMCY